MSKKNQNVPTIKQQDLTMEIAVALKELFVAQIESDEEGITMRFSNGQKFRIMAQEA